jgi:hypothetical protein
MKEELAVTAAIVATRMRIFNMKFMKASIQ